MNTLWYLSLFTPDGLAEAVAAAERWISEGGFNPHRFTWECRPLGAYYQLHATCPEDRAR